MNASRCFVPILSRVDAKTGSGRSYLPPVEQRQSGLLNNVVVAGEHLSSETQAAEFLIADLDVALTFMDVAHTSGDEEIVARNYRNARKAYGTVMEFLSKLTLMPSDRETVKRKLAVVKARLEAVGLPV